MREKSIEMLGRAMLSLLKPLKEAGDGALEIKVKDGAIRICFLMIASYCCQISEARDTSADRHGAGRR